MGFECVYVCVCVFLVLFFLFFCIFVWFVSSWFVCLPTCFLKREREKTQAGLWGESGRRWGDCGQNIIYKTIFNK